MGILRLAARDPGGANVLAALLVGWRLPPKVQADAWAMERARSLIESGVPVLRFAQPPSGDELERLWHELPADLLITGTSHYEPFEQTLWGIARRAGVPSLAILDQWMNVERRFSLERPQFVGALDRTQAEELRHLGFSADAILVVGHPWLAELGRRRQALSEPETGSSEPETGSTVRVLFASEPIRGDVEAGVNRPFGYDEFDAFAVVFDGAVVAAARGAVVELVVKCHPYEDVIRFRASVAALPQVPGVTVRCAAMEDPAMGWIEWADLVIGISSMLLIEAMVVGRPVVSVQPRLAREETFAPATRGAAVTVTDPVQGREIVAALILDPARRQQMRARHKSFVDDACVDARPVLVQWIESSLARSA